MAKWTADELGFPVKGIYSDLVSTFVTSFVGTSALFLPKVSRKNNGTLTLKGNIVSNISIRTEGHYQGIRDGRLNKQDYVEHLLVMLANVAGESMKNHPAYKQKQCPELQFLRHIRNAASHGNRFNFTKNEPKHVASWRGAVIPGNPKGSANPLHGKKCLTQYLTAADLILLMKDVEDILSS